MMDDQCLDMPYDIFMNSMGYAAISLYKSNELISTNLGAWHVHSN